MLLCVVLCVVAELAGHSRTNCTVLWDFVEKCMLCMCVCACACVCVCMCVCVCACTCVCPLGTFMIVLARNL